MGLFNRQSDRVPIKEYLRATDAVSRPLAILLTLIVLFVCAALIFSLFLGGRWLYRRLVDENITPTVVQVETPQNSSSPTLNPTPTIKPTTTPTPTPIVKPSTTPTPTLTPTPTPTPTASTVPNTGPEPE